MCAEKYFDHCKYIKTIKKYEENVIFLMTGFLNMKIKLILTGKTSERYIKEGLELYEKRLMHYVPFEKIELPELKSATNFSQEMIREKEADQQLRQLSQDDFVVLLDEKGKEYRSLEFASYVQQRMNCSTKSLVFIIGGPFGFSAVLHKRANAEISLSRLTFSHQIVRLLFMEQLYRALTILKNEKYHHE